jgi:hypothetical protein
VVVKSFDLDFDCFDGVNKVGTAVLDAFGFFTCERLNVKLFFDDPTQK